jgi:hypothetical protein
MLVLSSSEDCPKLERLSLGNTQVSDAGIERLKLALPDCDIVR